MYGPCSRTTTLKPFVESSFARMPPAAPEPTIAKSTTSDGWYLGWPGPVPLPINFEIALVILRRFLCGGCRLPTGVAFVVVTKRWLKTVLRQAANHGPADAAAIATTIGFRINQEAGQGAGANRFEKLCCRSGYEIRARTSWRRFRSGLIE